MRFSSPFLPAHPFDPSDGLDAVEVAMLAVANNPDLKLARDDAGIARAQAFAAGLLPDPQLNFTRDFPFAAGPPTVTAFGLGLSYDVGSLVARSAAESAARSEQQKVDLNVLWQEWQTIGQARLLFVKIVYQQRTLDALERSRDLLALLHARAGAALDRGEVAVGSVTPMLTALQDAARRVAEQSRQLAQSREDLNALLGLPPGTVLKLVDSEEAAHIDEATVRGLLSELPQRRADLMALKAGYGAQEQRLRQAVLAQFPALNIGLTRTRDNTGINMRGFAITMSLPVFNRNRGAIAVEGATRERLHDEYQTRLTKAYADIERLLIDRTQLEAQRRAIETDVEQLGRIAGAAQSAFDRGDLDAFGYISFRSAAIGKQIDALAIAQLIAEQRVALETLLGAQVPAAQRVSSGP